MSTETKEAIKEKSMIIQKDMLAKLFHELSITKETGKKVKEKRFIGSACL